MLGISVYFQDLNLKYLEEAKKCGAKYVFTSLHIPEEDYSDLDQKLPLFLEKCHSLRLQVVPDVSPVTFEKLNIPHQDYKQLKRMGFKALRLDYGFDDYEVIKELQKDFYLMLNASVVNDQYLKGAQEAGVDFDKLALTHNFYPHSETGLSLEYFQKKNKTFQKYHLTVQAFVCGDVLKRFPLYEGLPTVEKHRTMNPYVAAVELIHDCGIKDILIGDSEASISTLKNIQAYMDRNIMHIPCHLEKEYEYLYDQEIQVRKDLAEKIVRLTLPRTPDIPIFHNTIRQRGYIVMENKLAGRYSGEVHIIKESLPFEARTNVIGFIHPEYIDIIDYIDAQTTIVFERI